VTCLAFSGDGKILASGSKDRSVYLWDVATGRELRHIAGGEHAVQLLALSPDGSTVAVHALDISPQAAWAPRKCAAHLYEVSTGKEQVTLPGRDFTALTFSPDQRLLALGDDEGGVALWDVVRSAEVARLTGHRGSVTTLDFSADGKLLASGGGDTTILI